MTRLLLVPELVKGSLPELLESASRNAFLMLLMCSEAALQSLDRMSAKLEKGN